MKGLSAFCAQLQKKWIRSKISRNFSDKMMNYSSSFKENAENADKKGAKISLTNAQIEQYKKQLYELIQQRRDMQSINQLTKHLIDNCEPSLHLFNVILKGQLMMRNVEGIKDTLIEIAKNKFAFNSVTLNLLLVYYRDLGMMEEAEKLFQAISDSKNESNPLINCAGPNLSAYTTMIAGWARCGNYGKAKAYYEALQKEADLVPDEHAKCAMLSAAVNFGQLEDAKMIFKSIGENANFVSLKLWLRASLRLGGYEKVLRKLLAKNEDSLEIGEIIKWIVSDIKGSDIISVASKVIDNCFDEEVRLGDPLCLHSLVDAVKKDPEQLEALGELCLKWPGPLLPVIGGRIVYQFVSLKMAPELADKVVRRCEQMGVKLPSGLLLEYSQWRNSVPK